MTPLSQLDDENGNGEKAIITDGEGEEDSTFKFGMGRKGSWGSMSVGLDSSYAIVDREAVSEDSGVLRRRQNVQR